MLFMKICRIGQYDPSGTDIIIENEENSKEQTWEDNAP
jgi:hypothetical protein